MKQQNWIFFVLMVLIWGSNWAVRKSGTMIVGPLTFASQSIIVSTIALLPFVFFFKKQIPRNRKTWLHLAVLAITYALLSGFTYLGLVYEGSGVSSVVSYTQPLFVFVFAVTFLGEKMSVVRLSGILLGFVGVAALYLVRGTSAVVFSLPLLFLLLGALLWAVNVVYYKKFLSHVNPMIANCVTFIIGGLLVSVFAGASEGFFFPATMDYLFALLYNGVGASTVAWTIWIYLIREEETTTVSGSSLLVPMVALILGWILLREVVEPRSVITFALILAGVFLVNRKPRIHK